LYFQKSAGLKLRVTIGVTKRRIPASLLQGQRKPAHARFDHAQAAARRKLKAGSGILTVLYARQIALAEVPRPGLDGLPARKLGFDHAKSFMPAYF
jgi:hypothetical protein